MSQAYPLLWPEGWPRTKNRSLGQYRTGLPGSLKNLRDQLRMLCGDAAARTLVMSSNITLGVESPADTGVVAYFTWDGQAMAIPCDRWPKVEHNVQAIALTIEGMSAPRCEHTSLHFMSGGYYVGCMMCGQTWVARRMGATDDTDLDRGPPTTCVTPYLGSLSTPAEVDALRAEVGPLRDALDLAREGLVASRQTILLCQHIPSMAASAQDLQSLIDEVCAAFEVEP